MGIDAQYLPYLLMRLILQYSQTEHVSIPFWQSVDNPYQLLVRDDFIKFRHIDYIRLLLKQGGDIKRSEIVKTQILEHGGHPYLKRGRIPHLSDA